MYYLYMDKVLFPIAPSKLQLKIKGKNKTITLINEGEVNIIKSTGLTEVTFDVLLPLISKYPFAVYPDNKFQKADYYLSKLENMKRNKNPVGFVFSRLTPQGTPLFDTNMQVTLESYDIVEDAKNTGLDIKVSVTLKQWRNYGVKRIQVKEKKTVAKSTPARVEKDPEKTYTVVKGDCLYKIAKKQLNNANRWPEIYNLNQNLIEQTAKKYGRRSSSNGHWIYPGTVLKLPK